MSKIETVTIGIGVENIAKATEWYKKLLGDVEVIEPAPGTVELQLNEHTWLQLDDTGYLTTGGGSTIIRLSTQNIEKAHENAKTLGSDVTDIETVEGVVRYFDFQDPDSNRISYYQILAQ